MFYELTDRFIVAAGVGKVWQFFGDPANLARITPPQLRFEIVAPPGSAMQRGTIIDYRIRWLGLALRWRTEIIDYSPPRQFIDLQTRGPYALWLHQHTFEEAANGVICADRVIYRLPLGIIGRAAHALMVRRQLVEIFRFRREAIARQLGPIEPLQDARIRVLG